MRAVLSYRPRPYKVVVIKAVWYWLKDRRKVQWNRIESPGETCVYGQLIFNKGAKTIALGRHICYTFHNPFLLSKKVSQKKFLLFQQRNLKAYRNVFFPRKSWSGTIEQKC